MLGVTDKKAGETQLSGRALASTALPKKKIYIYILLLLLLLLYGKIDWKS
jgi:hypothetical protein